MRLSVALAATLSIASACSDDTDTTTSGAGGSTATTTSGTAGGGATSQGGSGGGATCGPPITFDPVHGCDVDALTDMTGESEVTIGYGFSNGAFIYEPKCLHVCAGTTVTFEPIDGTSFQVHPLQGGASTPDADSPFGYLADPDEETASFTLTEPGTFPYYCIAHLGSGMIGVVYVQ